VGTSPSEYSDLIFTDIVFKGVVVSTFRDAHVRDFITAVLSDCFAAFSETGQQNALANLVTVSTLFTCNKVFKAMNSK
jgi:nicotinamidase-related amidase